jgi:electron transfer flavoprotein beta subunit
MKILVCISHVPDTTTKIQFSGDGKSLNAAGVTFVINPNDEFGLSRAIGFQEEGKQVTITAISVGGAEVEPTLRKALAIGANDAVRINAPATDAAFVAKQIAEYAKNKGFDLIFTGKESIDYNGSMVPGMLAEMLQIPFVSFATKIDLTSDTTATVLREVDGGQEVLSSSLPAVVSCQKDVAKERIPNMRGIMSSRTKPLAVVQPSDNEGFVNTVSYNYPPAKGGCTYLKADSEVEKLAEILHAKGFI